MGKKDHNSRERHDESESSLSDIASTILNTIKEKADELGETWRQSSESALEQVGKTWSSFKDQAEALTEQKLEKKNKQREEDRNKDDSDDDKDEDEDEDEDD
ncbi:MAG: hypothetical protein IGS50_06035 [Synechococcales cyanobacterium C42_A2020_086]|jgi:hypothetical protein|nr:hypothetical protein [Synechococcales cyanobacterium C42_A2020_086]